jgi:hypothetical protein
VGRLLDSHRRLVRSTRAHPAIGFGSSMAAGFALFGWLGWRADQRFHSEPWGVLAGVGLAFLYSGYELWKLLRRTDPPGDKNGAPPASAPPDG